MSVRTSRKVVTSAHDSNKSQHGVSAVTIAVVLAAVAVVTLTIVQAATTGAQTGIPGLIG
ncbi:MAG: hypothetical protein O2921_01405 [Chloroflexi bacterium]|jgi:hypothetical protein|nr:hypothetical protein [Chloroflexota bacterium]MDA1281275.1 hypothetical protein [Chloroflexota bacterium]